MPNIYQIRSEIENFAAEVDEETGEFLNAEAWDALNMAYEEKIENTACYIKNLKASISDLKAEEDNLKERRQRKEKKVAQLEKLLADNLSGNKFESARCEISFRKSTKVDVLDISLLPENLVKISTTTSPDKTAIGKLLKEGVEIAGCSLIENQNISIK